jgi:hypothetical protein
MAAVQALRSQPHCGSCRPPIALHPRTIPAQPAALRLVPTADPTDSPVCRRRTPTGNNETSPVALRYVIK